MDGVSAPRRGVWGVVPLLKIDVRGATWSIKLPWICSWSSFSSLAFCHLLKVY
jgi:hypothetical protein